MRRTPLALSVALALSLPVSAQQVQAPPPADGTIPVSYVGTNARVSLGVDDDLDLLGELLYVFGQDQDSAWLFEGWVGDGGAGGVKLDYHWLTSGGATVAKVFGAVDQNAFDDRKATLGFGLERENLFFDVYGSAALTDERLSDEFTDAVTTTITGTEGGRPFQQTQTVTTLTRVFEHPYDWGVGVRVGHHFESQLARIRAGLDYEDGDFGSKQYTVSLGLDKYIANTGHSLTVEVEHYERNGDFVIDDSDTRAWLLWRYEFGQSFRPAETLREIAVAQDAAPAPAPAVAAPEQVVMKNDVRMDTDAFFDFDRSELRPEAIASLEEMVAAIKSERRVSRVRVTGHTCDIGTHEYNQGLSERRAASVREFLASRGVDVAEMDVEGQGETNPTFPNDGEENRRKNRRVDVEFLTVEEAVQPAPAAVEPAPAAETQWVREKVDAPPAWIERALRNPAEHKRTVDVYRFEEVTETTTLGPRQFINRPPLAVNDAVNTNQCPVEFVVPVLANDTDPDGDVLRIVSAASVAGADVIVNANGTITVRPRPGSTLCQTGATFTYTIADPAGATSSATVQITITNGAPDARDDAASTGRNQPVTVNVLANDSDPDGDTIRVASVTQPGNGQASIGANGQVTYTPNANFSGTDTFTYRIEDGRGGSDTANVTVTVLGNRPPVAVDDFLNTFARVPTQINVLANDSDPDGDTLTVISITQPANGTAVLNADGTITYTSVSNYCGLDPFTYTIRDPSGATATATVTPNVLD